MIKFNSKIEPPKEEKPISRIKFGEKPSVTVPIVIPPVAPHKLFSTPNDPLLDKSLEYVKTNFNDLYNKNEQKIRNMLRTLITCDLNIVMNWGDEALSEQRDILKVVTSRMTEFAQLNGNELLKEILDSSNKIPQTSLMQRLTNGLHKPQENYANRIEALKIRLKGIFEPVHTYKDKITASNLPLWSATIAAVNECVPLTDDTIEEAMLNRRKILYQAVQNLQVVAAQLEQTRTMIVKQQSEVDYIMNVVIPSLDLAKP